MDKIHQVAANLSFNANSEHSISCSPLQAFCPTELSAITSTGMAGMLFSGSSVESLLNNPWKSENNFDTFNRTIESHPHTKSHN